MSDWKLWVNMFLGYGIIQAARLGASPIQIGIIAGVISVFAYVSGLTDAESKTK